ncbi:MAG: hypothetical protein M8354_06650, partial [Halalkalicoccus sp.]|nr:hypothetical protein [Halalkalicoccus sp.]
GAHPPTERSPTSATARSSLERSETRVLGWIRLALDPLVEVVGERTVISFMIDLTVSERTEGRER